MAILVHNLYFRSPLVKSVLFSRFRYLQLTSFEPSVFVPPPFSLFSASTCAVLCLAIESEVFKNCGLDFFFMAQSPLLSMDSPSSWCNIRVASRRIPYLVQIRIRLPSIRSGNPTLDCSRYWLPPLYTWNWLHYFLGWALHRLQVTRLVQHGYGLSWLSWYYFQKSLDLQALWLSILYGL